MEFPAGMFLGLVVGVAISSLMWAIGLSTETDQQFEKDCKSMAHGTIDKSAYNICVKDGKILFHK